MKYFILAMLFPLMVTAQILRPNLIVNGDAVLDQRGSATITIPAGGVGNEYGPDRWRGSDSATTGAGRIMQGTTSSTDAPYILGLRNTVKHLVTTGYAPTGVEAAGINYRLEGLDMSPFVNKTMTYSFWVRSKKTGAFCVRFVNPTADRNFVKQFNILSADTWQEMSVPINFKNATGGTDWVTTNALSLQIIHYIATGSSTSTIADSTWGNSGSVTSACLANNLGAATNDYVEITGVRLTEGAQKVPFVRAGGGSYAAELSLAERYTQCFNAYGVGTGFFNAGNGTWNQIRDLRTPMRIAPSAIFRTDGGALTGLNCGSTTGTVNVGNATTGAVATCTAGSASLGFDGGIPNSAVQVVLRANGTSISGTGGDVASIVGIFEKTLCVSAEL